MKLVEGIKQTGKPYYIPDCPRGGLPEFFAGLGYTLGAEIGVYKGKFCEKFCEHGINMFAIDNWADADPKKQERQDYLYSYTQKVLRRFTNTKIIRETSLTAVEQFTDNSLDFVYIDADHTYEGISADLPAWYAKVRPGGVVSGHDYAYSGVDLEATQRYYTSCQVGPVVDAFVATNKIPSFYIFGRSKPIELESKNDRYLSWLFFKPL